MNENEEIKKIAAQVEKAISNYYSSGGTYTISTGTTSGWGFICGEVPDEHQFIPTKVIYNCPATICFFPDGTKEVVRCADDEEYIKEVGVMACIMKKLFKSRRQFVKLVESGYENTDSVFERNAHNATLRRKQR